MNLTTQTEATLMEYGLLNPDRSFCSKLSSLEIEQFLKGEPLCATSGRERLTFLLDPYSRNVTVRESTLEKSLSYVQESSSTEFLQLVKETATSYGESSRYEKKAYLKDEASGELMELDLVKHLSRIGKEVLEKGDVKSQSRYRTELFRIKNYYLKQMKKYPHSAKDFKAQLGLVSKELSKVSRSVRSLSGGAEPKASKVPFEKEPARSSLVEVQNQTQTSVERKVEIGEKESQVETTANSLRAQQKEKLELEKEPYRARRR
ncbi:hypothetical protein [Chryseobacterium sp. A321]